MRIDDNGTIRDMTAEETAALSDMMEYLPPTLEDRVDNLEKTVDVMLTGGDAI